MNPLNVCTGANFMPFATTHRNVQKRDTQTHDCITLLYEIAVLFKYTVTGNDDDNDYSFWN